MGTAKGFWGFPILGDGYCEWILAGFGGSVKGLCKVGGKEAGDYGLVGKRVGFVIEGGSTVVGFRQRWVGMGLMVTIIMHRRDGWGSRVTLNR